MTPRRSHDPGQGQGEEADLSYFVRERPIGLLLSNLAAVYERAFLLGVTADASFASITAADHAILRCVAQRSATSTEIARTLGISKQAIGKTVNALERRGYVVRSRSAVDLRAQVISMTDQGRLLIERSIRVAESLEARTQAVLGAQDLALLKALLVRTQDAEDQLPVAEPRPQTRSSASRP
jgi:DNA-binding MarR family transcriptional regulator